MCFSSEILKLCPACKVKLGWRELAGGVPCLCDQRGQEKEENRWKTISSVPGAQDQVPESTSRDTGAGGRRGQKANLGDEYTARWLARAPSASNASKMMSSDFIGTRTLIVASGEDQVSSTSSSHWSVGLCFPQLLVKAELSDEPNFSLGQVESGNPINKWINKTPPTDGSYIVISKVICSHFLSTSLHDTDAISQIWLHHRARAAIAVLVGWKTPGFEVQDCLSRSLSHTKIASWQIALLPQH